MAFSWDVFFVLIFTVMAIYGLFLGGGRIFNILISAFVGHVIAIEMGEFVYSYLSKAAEISHSANITLFGAKIFVFVAVVFVLMLRNELGGSSSSNYRSRLNVVAIGALAAGFILSSVLMFMSANERLELLSASVVAEYVYDYRLFWVIGPILLIIVNAAILKLKK